MRWIQKISLCLGLGAIAMASVAHAQQQQFVNVLTGGQSGVYYPLGVALSQVYAKSIPNARATAQVTKASAENLNLLQAGRGELAFTLGDALSDAWKGDAEAGFPKKLDKLRGLSATYNNYIQIVANADAGIKTLADLKGKRISVGAAKSGTELNARAIFKAAGMSYADLAKVEYLPFGESVELIKNRQLDATLQSAGLGVASIRDLATAVKIVVVPVPADVVAKVVSDWTGIPVGKMQRDQAAMVMNMADILRKRINGQDYALQQIAEIDGLHIGELFQRVAQCRLCLFQPVGFTFVFQRPR